MTKKVIEKALNDESSEAFAHTTTVLAVLTLISVLATAGETISFFKEYTSVFVAIEWLTIGIFTIEYGLRIWTASSPRTYILSYLGLLDLVSILPTYLGVGSLTFLRSARMVRTMRFIRIIGRTNISHVQNKGKDLSKDFTLSPKMVLGALFCATLVCVFLYQFFSTDTDTLSGTIKVFLEITESPMRIGFEGAMLIMLGRFFGALGFGLCVGLCMKVVEERLRR